MGNIGDILSKKIKSLGIEKQVEAADVCERTTKEIAKHIPREDFEVISFKRGVLRVFCQSAPISSEIFLLSSQIKKEIKEISKISTTLH